MKLTGPFVGGTNLLVAMCRGVASSLNNRFYKIRTNHCAALRVRPSETRDKPIHGGSAANIVLAKVSEGLTRISAGVLWILVGGASSAGRDSSPSISDQKSPGGVCRLLGGS